MLLESLLGWRLQYVPLDILYTRKWGDDLNHLNVRNS
jgi:hypothetical protein